MSYFVAYVIVGFALAILVWDTGGRDRFHAVAREELSARGLRELRDAPPLFQVGTLIGLAAAQTAAILLWPICGALWLAQVVRNRTTHFD